MLLDLREQDLLQILCLQAILFRPQHLQPFIVSIGVKRIRAIGEHGQEDVRRRESRIQKLCASGGKGLIGRRATMDTESA
ncbi:hypothetical protein ACF1BQ_007840 [Bradyrhizobium sp. RDT10]